MLSTLHSIWLKPQYPMWERIFISPFYVGQTETQMWCDAIYTNYFYSKNALEHHLLLIIISPLKCKQIQNLQKAMSVFNQGGVAAMGCPPLFFCRQALQMYWPHLQIPLSRKLSLIFLQSSYPLHDFLLPPHKKKNDKKNNNVFIKTTRGSEVALFLN